jgi:hypothetical protein
MTVARGNDYVAKQVSALVEALGQRVDETSLSADTDHVDITVSATLDDGDGVMIRTTLRFEMYEKGQRA